MTNLPTQPKKAKPTRVKHVPIRTCVACRRSDAKRGLVRIVRSPEGRVTVDERGKENGRGAYLCRSRACWDIGLKGSLARALKATLSPEDLAALRDYAESIPAGDTEEESR